MQGREKKAKEQKAARRLSAVSLRFHFLPPQARSAVSDDISG